MTRRLVAGAVLVVATTGAAIAAGRALPAPGFSDPGTYAADAPDDAARGVARGTLVLRAGRHAETKFVITPPAGSADAGDPQAIAGNLDAGGFFATFADPARDCRLRFAFHGTAIVVAQTGTCGFAGRTSVAGVYRRS